MFFFVNDGYSKFVVVNQPKERCFPVGEKNCVRKSETLVSKREIECDYFI